ncbi:hypothetical protein ACHQM5_018098 [Ranunculus cassubicifolius]
MYSAMSSTTTTMSMFIPSARRTRNSVVMASSKKNTDQLRIQLHQLHTEAQRTRDKASNARLRLMRLSEAAMKLQQQAANDVRIGRENEAREVLVQKRKVMQALEKSKSRVEMLDELLTKLNEAITLKETQLIGNVSSGVEDVQEDISSNVRIISPKESNANINQDQENEPSENGGDHMVRFLEESDANAPMIHENEDVEDDSLGMNILNEAELVKSLKDMSSYEGFLLHLDKQLNQVEDELNTFLKLSTLVLESGEKLKNSKVLQAHEILENVQKTRSRIAIFTKRKVGIN